MPMVQYSHPSRGINRTKSLKTPRRIESLDHWMREVGKVHPDAPLKWTRSHILMTTETICVEFISREGEKFAIVIKRTPE